MIRFQSNRPIVVRPKVIFTFSAHLWQNLTIKQKTRGQFCVDFSSQNLNLVFFQEKESFESHVSSSRLKRHILKRASLYSNKINKLNVHFWTFHLPDIIRSFICVNSMCHVWLSSRKNYFFASLLIETYFELVSITCNA